MLDIKQRIINLQSTIPEKTENKENAKRNIHGTPLGKGSGQDLLSKLAAWGEWVEL